MALSSVAWAVGLAVGGPLGSAFTDWRWAFYLIVPLILCAVVLAAPCLPAYEFYPTHSGLSSRLARLDLLGILFNAAVPVLFAIAVTFPSAIWAWSSGPSVAFWMLSAFGLVSWMTQQHLCMLTTASSRALPLHMLVRLKFVPVWVASACAGVSYAITLTYMPLFFAFVRGSSPLRQAIKQLPFTVVFILTLLLTGRFLPRLRYYKLIYIVGGAMTVAGSAAMVATLSRPDVPDSTVLGIQALLGLGLGLQFQHGIGICSAISKDQEEKVNSIIFCNLALFGGIATTLAIAGSIFQNLGFHLLVNAIGNGSFSKEDIREALTGSASVVWREPKAMQRAVEIVATVIAREFYLSLAAGILCLLCGLVM